MEKAFVVQKVAKKLISAERSLDASIAEAAELMADLLNARREMNLSATVGDVAAIKLMEAMSALGQARTAMVGCHKELNETRLRLGIRTRMVGIEEKDEVAPAQPADVRKAG
jgi:hypothetical protein